MKSTKLYSRKDYLATLNPRKTLIAVYAYDRGMYRGFGYMSLKVVKPNVRLVKPKPARKLYTVPKSRKVSTVKKGTLS